MKSATVLKFGLAAILLVVFYPPVEARYSADRVFDFLQQTYIRHDNDVYDYFVTELNLFLQTFPDTGHAAEVSFILTKVYYQKGKKHEALASAYKTLYLFSDFSSRTECADLARELISKEKDFREKQQKLLGLLEDPFPGGNIAERHFAYLTFLMELGEDDLHKWTLTEARQFVSRFPQNSNLFDVLHWIGDLYTMMDDEKEAVLSYLKTEIMFPDLPALVTVRYKRANLLYRKLDEYQDALQLCNQMAITYPETEYAGASLYMAGEIKEEKLKDYQGAIVSYRQLVDTYPQHKKSISALLSIGEINLKKLKNYNATIAAYNEFIEKYQSSPYGVEALKKIGDIYEDDLKDYAKAAESYARIAELYPTFDDAPELLIKAGEICEDKLKDYKKAIEYYQIVVDKYPEDKKAGDAAKKIEKANNKMDN